MLSMEKSQPFGVLASNEPLVSNDGLVRECPSAPRRPLPKSVSLKKKKQRQSAKNSSKSRPLQNDWQKQERVKARAVILNVLSDGEWHSISELAGAILRSVSPEFLIRLADSRRRILHKWKSSGPLRKSPSNQKLLLSGSRWAVLRSIECFRHQKLTKPETINGVHGYRIKS